LSPHVPQEHRPICKTHKHGIAVSIVVEVSNGQTAPRVPGTEGGTRLGRYIPKDTVAIVLEE
jgi:hypothetical protein